MEFEIEEITKKEILGKAGKSFGREVSAIQMIIELKMTLENEIFTLNERVKRLENYNLRSGRIG